MPHTSNVRLADPASRVRRWFYFSTPIGSFLVVMGPIAALMLGLALLPGVPRGIRWSAGAVVTISVYACWRGYLHWVQADDRQISFCTPFRRVSIPWTTVQRVDRYTPPDRNRLTQYVYVTRLDRPPADRHIVDADTIQLQDRPGLLESLQARWSHTRNEAPAPPQEDTASRG